MDSEEEKVSIFIILAFFYKFKGNNMSKYKELHQKLNGIESIKVGLDEFKTFRSLVDTNKELEDISEGLTGDPRADDYYRKINEPTHKILDRDISLFFRRYFSQQHSIKMLEISIIQGSLIKMDFQAISFDKLVYFKLDQDNKIIEKYIVEFSLNYVKLSINKNGEENQLFSFELKDEWGKSLLEEIKIILGFY